MMIDTNRGSKVETSWVVFYLVPAPQANARASANHRFQNAI
jgi:hypothetical protein